jgi:hypothetical protein
MGNRTAGQSGKHILLLNFTGYDQSPTLLALPFCNLHAPSLRATALALASTRHRTGTPRAQATVARHSHRDDFDITARFAAG